MFSMDLGSGECGGHVVVALRGELDLVDAAAVAAALGVVAAREPQIIVDLARLDFIDSIGAAALARGRGYARNAGGDLLLAAPQRMVRRVLAIVWEADGFDIHVSVAEAAASAGASRRVVEPIPRQPARMRWQHIARNASAPQRRPVAGGRLPGGSWVPGCRPPADGGISG